ncbi:MAG: YtxH domain-containing protein [Bacteroidales bacterium]|nr:YtxH domain-containing protein [Bacteroidales bacterium]
MKAIEWMAAMLWGASIGAAAALLWTPYDGKHMRRKVCNMLRKSGVSCCNCATDDAEGDDVACHCENPSA